MYLRQIHIQDLFRCSRLVSKGPSADLVMTKSLQQWLGIEHGQIDV